MSLEVDSISILSYETFSPTLLSFSFSRGLGSKLAGTSILVGIRLSPHD
jgi:hypothetical protein